nr:DinI-like family protein [Providencia sp. PROV195]
MVTIKIRFNRNKKGQLPTGTFEALRNEITKRLSTKYPDLNIDINWSTQDNVSIDGLGKNEKKTYIEETLEEIFIDGDWLPETQEAEVEYFDKWSRCANYSSWRISFIAPLATNYLFNIVSFVASIIFCKIPLTLINLLCNWTDWKGYEK